MKTAFITGITGQDGSYLAEFLLSKGYEVHGLIRRSSSFNTGRLDPIYKDPHVADNRLFLHHGDMSDSDMLANIISTVKPDEIYNLAAQSHVAVSFESPEYTGNVTALGTTRLLQVIRRCDYQGRYYQASSSEMFGSSPPPQNEDTPLQPRSPYSCAKVYAYWMARNYRDGYGIHASNGILFNHESPRRGETFVTRKITMAVARIKAGLDNHLYLGNLNTRRDWGYAPEYMDCAWRMLQLDEPGDYVVGTGESRTIKEFVDAAFGYARLDPDEHVVIDPRYFRPTEVDDLVADSSKAKRVLGWTPKVKFKELVKIMVDADMKLLGVK